MKYKVKFEAVTLGAIGKKRKFTDTVEGENYKDAHLKLYDKYEHIFVFSVNGVPYSYEHNDYSIYDIKPKPNKPIYLNVKTSQGIETVDEFTREHGQNPKEFRKYVSEMVGEYVMSGQNVYKSTRCTKDWKSK